MNRNYRISLIIPAFNEEKTIGNIIEESKKYVDEIIVVDDGSIDNTGIIAKKNGARVIRHRRNKGYIEALRTGFKEARGDIIVTMDADGEHDPSDIPRLLEPIINDNADLVLGVRKRLIFSERIITLLTRLKVDIKDASTGFRAIRSDIAKKMKLIGKCTCGTFVLEAYRLGARIKEIEIKTKRRKVGKSRVKKRHFIQSLIVLKELLRI